MIQALRPTVHSRLPGRSRDMTRFNRSNADMSGDHRFCRVERSARNRELPCNGPAFRGWRRISVRAEFDEDLGLPQAPGLARPNLREWPGAARVAVTRRGPP